MRQRYDQTGADARCCSRIPATPAISSVSAAALPQIRNGIVDVQGRLPTKGLQGSQGHPEGCSKISRGPALHQPGTNVAPTGALA